MSPFAAYLIELRKSRQLRQRELAELMGYEQSYLSALERCDKGPPRREFIARLTKALVLTEDEQQQLAVRLKSSCRQFALPHKASEAEYYLVNRLEPQLGRLQPLQIKLMNLALDLQEPEN